jgi:sulfate permease, SulP family
LQALRRSRVLRRSGRTLLFCGAPAQPAALLLAAEFHRHVGEENICKNIEAALKRAKELVGSRAA